MSANAGAEETQTSDISSLIREKLKANPDGVLEAIARECNVPTLAVLRELPSSDCTCISGVEFEDIWNEIVGWGEVLFIVHTADIVFECKSPLPPGSFGRGYFNFHGGFAASGHLRETACAEICIVDRAFHGRRSCSVQFFNENGEAIFKIFVRRDSERNLDAAQLRAFERLRSENR